MKRFLCTLALVSINFQIKSLERILKLRQTIAASRENQQLFEAPRDVTSDTQSTTSSDSDSENESPKEKCKRSCTDCFSWFFTLCSKK